MGEINWKKLVVRGGLFLLAFVLLSGLLGLVLGSMTETNFRRALLISDGSPSIFFQSIYCKIFLALIVVALAAIIRGKLKEAKAAKAAVQKEDN